MAQDFAKASGRQLLAEKGTTLAASGKGAGGQKLALRGSPSPKRI